jgi:tRNA dimethylallyltransferase
LQKQATIPLPYDFIKIGIWRDRRELYGLINERVDNMLKRGLVDEVRKIIELINRHCQSISNLSSMQAIGYKEIAMYLNKEITLEDAIRLIKKRSRNYAKRQFTWFKNEDNIMWIDVTGILKPEDIFMKLLSKLDFNIF